MAGQPVEQVPLGWLPGEAGVEPFEALQNGDGIEDRVAGLCGEAAQEVVVDGDDGAGDLLVRGEIVDGAGVGRGVFLSWWM